MKTRLLTTACAVVLAALCLAGTAPAQSAPRKIVLTGQIVTVDRVNRTLTVTEDSTGRVYVVRVPPDGRVGIEPTGGLPSEIPFAHVVRGLKFRDTVRSTPKAGAST
jgi:hypothetical protein